MSNDQEASVSNIELAADYKGTLGGAVLRHTIIFFVIMFIWEMANRTGFSNPLLLPRPTDIVASIWKIYVTQGNVWYHPVSYTHLRAHETPEHRVCRLVR